LAFNKKLDIITMRTLNHNVNRCHRQRPSDARLHISCFLMFEQTLRPTRTQYLCILGKRNCHVTITEIVDKYNKAVRSIINKIN